MKLENIPVQPDWEKHASLDEVVAVIKKCAGNETLHDRFWSWAKNSRCKYVSLRIDMRDGDFVLLDREGNRITIEDLKRQL